MQNTKARLTWTAAGLLSLVLNIFLFGLMPALVTDNLLKSNAKENYQSISITRLKPPEPVEKKIEKPEKKIKPQELKPLKHPLIKKKIDLPKFIFEINTKLSGGPEFLPSHPLATTFFFNTGLKNIYEIGDLDSPPVPVAQVPPVYPFNLKRKGIEGWVKVQFLVNKQGVVEKVHIVESNPGDLFDRSVKKCVSSWRFSPGTVEGVAVNTWIVTTIKFELE